MSVGSTRSQKVEKMSLFVLGAGGSFTWGRFCPKRVDRHGFSGSADEFRISILAFSR